MNILLCCCAGMSSSILVKNMRRAAITRGLEDVKIASVSAMQVVQYIQKADVLLVAPQQIHELEHLKDLGETYHVPVLMIGREEYGTMSGEIVLDHVLQMISVMNREEVKMDRVSQFIEKRLMPIAVKVGSNRILTIIRNTMCASMALLIVGSISILLSSFPYEPVAEFMAPAAPFFDAIYNCTTGVMGLFTAAAMAYYASNEYKTDVFPSIVTSVAAFLLTQYTVEEGINIGGLGTSGLLSAMFVAFCTVKILHIFKAKNLVIKMPEGVPEAVSASFSSLIPAALIMMIFASVSVLFGFNINTFISTLLSPISHMLNNPFGYALYHMLCGLAFFCGINSAVVCDIAFPFIIANGTANEAAFAAGEAVLNPATYGTDTLVWAGGTGATIGLVFLMSFIGKSKYFKTLGRMSVGPAIFNINEPVIFGTPICFNPLFLLPFILLPGVIAFTTYQLMASGIIGMPIVGMVPWTTPPVLIGFLMSGGNVGTTIWALLVVIISLLVYYPFFKIADKQQYEKELHDDAEEKGANA